MQLFTSWKESVAIFAPRNIIQFLRMTFKSIGMAYKTLLMYCWLPLGLYIFGDTVRLGALPLWLADSIGFKGVVTLSNSIWGSGVLLLVIFLAARPSVLPKTYRYFLQYWYYAIYIALFLWANVAIKNILLYNVGLHSYYIIYFFIIMILAALFILFLLDSDGCPGKALVALWRSLKMFVYNMPGILIAWCIPFIVHFIVVLIVKNGGWLLKSSLSKEFFDGVKMVVLSPIYACVITNVYVKRLHEQFGLYFKTK